MRSVFSIAAVAVLTAGLAAGATLAGVTTTVSTHWFEVEGRTARQLVSYLNSHAIAGDHGHAYASVHPNYSLSLDTRDTGKQCRATRVDVRIAFDLTLPVAASPGAMSAAARRAWTRFAGFARAHEAHHQASYTSCASGFVAWARRMTASGCVALESQIRQAFAQMRRDCEARQMSFDRSQARVLRGLSLFSMAQSSRK